MDQFSLLLVLLLVFIIILYITAYIIMVSYNNSIVKMNLNWKPMDFKVALFFTIFSSFVFRVPINSVVDSIVKE